MGYRVFVVPSSDDEEAYESISHIDDAIDLHRVREDAGGDSGSLHEFATLDEAEAFIKGYELGIGYLGDGILFRDYITSNALG